MKILLLSQMITYYSSINMIMMLSTLTLTAAATAAAAEKISLKSKFIHLGKGT
jgi:hypothetical protein